MKKLLLTGLALLALAPSSFAELILPDAPDGYVLDQAEILSAETEAQLQTDLAALQEANSTQMVVVTVTDLQGYEPEQFALKLGREWGVGQEEFDNGLVYLIVPSAQLARIEVGYGLEGAITDAQSSMILNQVAIPYFKTGNYDQGVLESMVILEKLARGEAYDLSQLETSAEADVLPIILFFFTTFFWAFASILSGTKSWWLGGVFGGIFGGIVAGFSGLIFGALVGLFADYILSTYFFGKLTSTGGSGGFFRGGRRGGGSSGGGFGGFGGGSFGGGGATGRW